jgi:hypothetical protein
MSFGNDKNLKCCSTTVCLVYLVSMGSPDIFQYMPKTELRMQIPVCPNAEGHWFNFIEDAVDRRVSVPISTIRVHVEPDKTMWNDFSIDALTIRKTEPFGDFQTYLVITGPLAGFVVSGTKRVVRPLRSEFDDPAKKFIKEKYGIRGNDWFTKSMLFLLEKKHIPLDTHIFTKNCKSFTRELALMNFWSPGF